MSMMRRFTLVLLALATVLSLASCNIYIVENMNGMGT